MSPPDGPNFCSQCGTAVSPGDAFCSDCGAALGGRTNRTSSGSFRRRVEDRTVEGWEVEHDYGDRVVMVDRGIGSLGVHALLFVFTAGLGNLLYAWYSYTTGADRIELREDGTERYVADEEDDADDSSLTPGRAVFSFLLALVGLSMLSGVSSLPAFFVGMASLAVALWMLPPVRERLEEREAVTKFGRARSTDEEVVHAPDAPCTACSRPVDTGVKRTFHETLYVAGVPVSRDEQGENYYCRECARGDPFTGGRVGAGEDSEREPEPEF